MVVGVKKYCEAIFCERIEERKGVDTKKCVNQKKLRVV